MFQVLLLWNAESIFFDALDNVLEQYLWGQRVAVVDDRLIVWSVPTIHCRKLNSKAHEFIVHCMVADVDTNNVQTVETWVNIFEILAKSMHYNFTIKSSFLEKIIIERKQFC